MSLEQDSIHPEDAVSTENWKPSNVEPLIRVIPDGLGITPEGIARYDRFMYGFGTYEGKMVTLISLLPAYPQSVQEIHKAITGAITEDVWFPTETSMQESYLDNALVPTGLAARIKEGWRVYYEATDEGEYPAKIIAATMLFDAASHRRSWKDVLGSVTSQSNSRSHINRIAILFSLMRGLSHEAGIAEATEIPDGVIGNNTRALSAQGLVHYDSVTPSQTQGWVSYRLTGNLEDVQHQPTRNRLRRNVVAYFRNNEIGNAKTIAEAVGRQDETVCINVLSELVAAGILIRTDYHGGVKQSNARITPEGRALLNHVLIPSLQVCSGAQPDARMTVIQDEVERNPRIMTRAMQLFQQTASGHNKQSAEQTEQNALRYIREHGPARYTQMIKDLGTSTGKALRKLIDREELRKHQDQNAVFYYIPGEQDLPSIEKVRIMFQYQAPDNLVPLKDRKKEEYHADMETPAFWQQLARDIEDLSDAVTESTFYRFYRSNNPDWMVRDDYKSGDYYNFIYALRKLGIAEPYGYVREYVAQTAETRAAAQIAQKLISEKLIDNLKQVRYEEGLKQFESDEFWETFHSDLEAFEPGVSFRSFIMYFTHDNRRAAEFDARKERVQGDHRLLLSWFLSHYPSVGTQPEVHGIPEQLIDNARLTMTAYLYAKSPEPVRQSLLEKFPEDFADIAQVDFSLIDSTEESVREYAERRLLALTAFARSAALRMRSINLQPREIEQVEKLIHLGERAKEHLIRNYEKIVRRVAGRFVNRGLDWHDVIQEGQLGLLKAIENFDRSSRKKFVAYATLYVKGYIQNALKGARNVVKRRSAVHQLWASVFRTQRELTQQYGRQPTIREIAQHLDAPEADVTEVFHASHIGPSLQDLVGEGEETELGDLVKDTNAPDPATVVEQQEMQETIRGALEQLPQRERQLIELHFNLGGEGEHTLESLRKRWGMKRNEIKNLLGEALEKLKLYLREKLQDP